ncbi:unnamed protein product [Calypogeia fissa]
MGPRMTLDHMLQYGSVDNGVPLFYQNTVIFQPESMLCMEHPSLSAPTTCPTRWSGSPWQLALWFTHIRPR